jgi:hypothetical protein
MELERWKAANDRPMVPVPIRVILSSSVVPMASFLYGTYALMRLCSCWLCGIACMLLILAAFG